MKEYKINDTCVIYFNQINNKPVKIGIHIGQIVLSQIEISLSILSNTCIQEMISSKFKLFQIRFNNPFHHINT